MKIQLLSCDAVRPDRRAITKMLVETADNMDQSTATEMTDNLLEGSEVEIEVSFNESSAYRALRKLNIDYEIVE